MQSVCRMEEQEMKKIAEQRRREKMEEKQARYNNREMQLIIMALFNAL